MYRSFFGLRSTPFNVNPDPRFLFLTAHAREALACLTYGIQTRRGFVLLTGEVGTGKTTLLNKLLEYLQGRNVRTAFLFNPRMEVDEFFDYMLADLGIPIAPGTKKSQILIKLNNWLLERYRAGEHVAVVIDEAQNLSAELLEEIRLLTNLETSTEKLLQVVLSGQPELEEKLARPELRQLRQRITLRCRTHALTLDETTQYITQRLQIAGAAQQNIFLPAAVAAAHHCSRGIPRLVNLVCEHALITAFAEQQKQIGADVIHAVAQDFELMLDDGTSVRTEREQEPLEIARALNAVQKVARRAREVEVPVKKGASTQ
jgi:type II secretory pathway predicted ATPase ExeA